ncbi:nuclear distribution protein nudE-like 1-B [Nilaparvata lugens]|uniref:nuclear distribution protein nudE-like 1-B n=1 Tax=Nilaparvata lugens TaxID=108931 RepID=UPI000B9975DC|nr:nuclear distribution protein nudE-like 1-B [Nilaparvata lugens]
MPKFENKDEEISYWQQRANDIEAELEEFRESSQMIEQELEASLNQAEKTVRELRMRNNRLQLDHDSVRDKLEQMQQEFTAQITELQEETTQSRSREENYVKYIRELEQKNDDLERAQRAMYVSLGEFERKLNSSIERNVLLESELDEKEQLKTMVQRLKDEARDLKQEMQIRDRGGHPDDIIAPNRKSSIKSLDTNKMPPSTPATPLRTVNISMGGQNLSMSPTTRISAMNIVGDLLRKVGALESKLAACRNTDGPREMHRGTRRLNRGTSTPSIQNLDRS